MKLRILRDETPFEVKTITVFIGEQRFRLTESVDGKLNIIKYSDGESDMMNIHPRTGNVIELF